MPTLIKGIIPPVTDPLLTLTAASANDQGEGALMQLCAKVFFSAKMIEVI